MPSKAELEAAAQEDRQRKEDREQAKLKKEEKSENESARKAVSDAVSAVKTKLGFKSGGSASSRADGCCIRGKTRA